MLSRVVLVALVAALMPAASAAAADVDNVGADRLIFTGDAGADTVTITRSGDTVRFDAGAVVIDDQTDNAVTCAEELGDVVCTGFTAGEIEAFLGDGNDTLTFVVPDEDDIEPLADGEGGNDVLNAGAEATTLFGGVGTDTLNGGGDGDLLRGDDDNDALNAGGGDDSLGGGAGDDVQQGGAGDDSFSGGSDDPGADQLIGGDGIDSVFYDGSAGPEARGVTVTLDGQANDGIAGENDNAQVEDVTAFNPGTGTVTNTIIGDGAANTLFVFGSAASTIDGGGGNDTLMGGAGADTFRARDGFADRVVCSGGADTVTADGFDQISGTCETVDAQGFTYATEDRVPSIAFVTPASGALLATSAPTQVTVAAADDIGIARVLLVDDGQVVGQSTTAPYTIPYQPRGGDVGNNQLAVVAVDTSGQTATAFRTVTVSRFTPRSISVSVRPTRDPRSPFRFVTTGRVNLPAGGLVTSRQGCTGVVSVQIKRGTRTISTRRANVTSRCTFSSTTVFRDASRTGRRGTLRVTVRFLGNTVLARRTASTRTVRVGPRR